MKSLAQPAPPPAKLTRELRGLALHRERGHEIEHTGHGVYTVPGCSGAGVHAVNLKTGECSCPDRTPAGETDKHVVAAKYVKAKTAT